MNESRSEESLSAELQRRIDAACDEFRLAWSNGKAPSIADYAESVPLTARPHLLRALLKVEIEQRRDSGGAPLTEQQLISAHPRVAPDLVCAFRELRGQGTARGPAVDGTVVLALPVPGAAHTIEHTPSRKDSHGLHIRCPHCSNPVELVADTPYEQICCSTCGSMFSLVDRGEVTKMSAPLQTIDRFDLIARLGVGGFGTVWKARDRDLDRVVAIKIPRRGQLSPAQIEQFFREARTAAQLRHPNIVPVHEVGREADTLFIVSDFVRGVTLSDWLTGNRPSPREVAELCIPVADGLHHAHEHGVVHRDLKPSNIMIDEAGRPYLTDFGLAKRDVGEITMTVDGQILGTPGYMSPEQARGQGHWTDRRTDIYSLGVILFELLTGELPFRGNAQIQIHKRLTEDAPDPRTLNRHIPRDLSTICLKCLEREPGRRYSTSAAVADELRRYLRGEPIEARPLSAPARLMRWAQRKPMVATTAALTVFLAVAGPVAALLIERQRSRLVELVAERNNLIGRYAEENRRATKQISDLDSQLDIWEGRANPWEFWPPKREAAPLRTVSAKLLEHANRTVAGPLNDGSYEGLSAARGFIGLAMMSDDAGRTEDARRYYERARDQLRTLLDADPTNAQISVALAQCHSELARLNGTADREMAAKDLENAREIYVRLSQRNADVEYDVSLLENVLNTATLAGYAEGQAQLAEAAEKHEQLSRSWPTDPETIYRLACFLTGHQPILSSADMRGSAE
jgi:hypothetical protein